MKNAYMTILLAAVIEFVSIFLPLKNSGSFKKYVSYILSLVIILSAATAVTGIFGSGKLTDVKLFSSQNTYSPDFPKYLYVDSSGAYSADKDGNKASATAVFCDLYIKEACLEIGESIKSELHKKFGIQENRIKVGVSVDISELENIKLTRVTLYADLPDVAKADLVKYTKELAGVKVVTDTWEK